MQGIIAIIISTFFASGKDLVSKGISSNIHGNVSACTSFIFALPWYILLLVLAHLLGYSPFEYTGSFFLYIILRALTDSVAEFCKMHALSHGEISFVANFFSLTPLFLIFIAPSLTGDQISNTGLFGVGVIVFASLLLLKSPKDKIPWKGVFYALAAALFFSLNICLDRLAVQQAGPIYSGFLMTLFSAIILTFPMLMIKEWMIQVKQENKRLWIRGLFEVLFMISKLFGLKYIEPQYASGIQKLTLVFTVALGGKTFDESDRFKRLMTSILIVIGSCIIIFSKITT